MPRLHHRGATANSYFPAGEGLIARARQNGADRFSYPVAGSTPSVRDPAQEEAERDADHEDFEEANDVPDHDDRCRRSRRLEALKILEVPRGATNETRCPRSGPSGVYMDARVRLEATPRARVASLHEEVPWRIENFVTWLDRTVSLLRRPVSSLVASVSCLIRFVNSLIRAAVCNSAPPFLAWRRRRLFRAVTWQHRPVSRPHLVVSSSCRPVSRRYCAVRQHRPNRQFVAPRRELASPRRQLKRAVRQSAEPRRQLLLPHRQFARPHRPRLTSTARCESW